MVNTFSEHCPDRRRGLLHADPFDARNGDFNMEDGIFLAKTIGEAVNGNMTIAEAVELYEREPMRKAYAK